MLFKRFLVRSVATKKSPVRILTTEGNNIHFNLAIEEYLFETANVDIPTLFLWRNSPTIVIGKHQNPWKECKVEEMKLNNVNLARRKTGGGAVYQDLGNTCFSFLTPFDKGQKIDYRNVNNQIIINALSKLGVKAEVSGRNDLIVDQKKFSGSAYRLHLGTKDGSGKKSLHHGTIMFSVDFKALQKYLNPNKKKLESKGVDSVISRVINLHQQHPSVNHNNFCEQIEKQFISYYGNDRVEKNVVNIADLKTTDIVNKNYERLKSWNWLYGECPYFKYIIERKFDWGLIQITFSIENGLIKECRVYSDCLYPEFIQKLNEQLVGVQYDGEGLNSLKMKLHQEFKENQNFVKMGDDACEWIKSQI